MYVVAKVACKYYNVSDNTLRRWAESGKIEYTKTEGGHHRYKIPDTDEAQARVSCVYARVSARKQEEDLTRQVESLSKEYPNHTVYKDIGSGINFHRKGFQTLVERVIRGEIKEVVVANRDRLTRFGFEFVEWLFQKYNTQIIIISDPKRDPQKEFVDGLLSIITVYTARYYGQRHGNANAKDPVLPDLDAEKAV